MDLTQLRYFCHVATLKSFSHAASELHIAQPALTRQIQALERELGVQLLVRHSRGAQPTSAGLSLLTRARDLLTLAEETKREVRALGKTACGTMSLGFPPGLGKEIVPKIIRAYRKKFPNVALDLVDGFSHDVRDMLLEERLTMGILSFAEVTPNLTVEPLFEEAIWLVSSQSRGPAPKSYNFADLSSVPLIQSRKAGGLRRYVEDRAADLGYELNVVIEAEASELMKQLILDGEAFHICPHSAVSIELGTGEYVGAPISGLSLSRLLAYRTDRPMTVAALEMKILVKEVTLNWANSNPPVPQGC